METASAHSLRVVQKLLWDAIAELLKPAEREEVRRRVFRGTSFTSGDNWATLCAARCDCMCLHAACLRRSSVPLAAC